MVHAPVIRPPALGATLVSVDEAIDCAPARSASRSRRKFPGGRRGRRVGHGQGVARAQGDVDGVARAAWSRQPGALSSRRSRRSRPGDCEPRAVRTARRRRSGRRGARGGAEGSEDKFAATYFWPCQSHASLAPSCAVADVRRDGADDLDLVASDLRYAGHAVSRVRTRPRDGSRRLHGGLRIVRHERRRPCRCRCRAPLEDHRQAGAGAVVASGRARLGSEGTAAATRPARRRRRRVAASWRGTRRCGFPRTAAARASCWPRNLPGFRRTAVATPPRCSRTAIRLVRRRLRQGARALDARHAAQPVQPARAG